MIGQCMVLRICIQLFNLGKARVDSPALDRREGYMFTALATSTTTTPPCLSLDEHGVNRARSSALREP